MEFCHWIRNGNAVLSVTCVSQKTRVLGVSFIMSKTVRTFAAFVEEYCCEKNRPIFKQNDRAVQCKITLHAWKITSRTLAAEMGYE